MTRTMVRLAGAIGVTFAVRDAISVIVGFERTMAELSAVTRATAADMQAFEETARRLGATTAFSAQQAGEGLLFLSRAGFTVQESITALPATLNLALAGTLELGRAADLASNILGQFNLGVSHTTRVVDTLVATANRANTNVPQLAEALEKVGPVANALGVSIEDTAAAIGKLGDQGIQGSEAGTALRAVFASLANPLRQSRQALLSLGLTTADVDIKTRGLSAVLQTLDKANLTARQSFKLFGREAAAAGLIVINSAEGFETLADNVRAAGGEAAAFSSIVGGTLDGQLKGLRSTIEELFLQTGDAGLAGALKAAVQFSTDLLRTLAGLEVQMDNATAATNAGVVAANFIVQAWKGLVVTGEFLKLGLIATAEAVVRLGAILSDFANTAFVVFGRVSEFISASLSASVTLLSGLLTDTVNFFRSFGRDILIIISDIARKLAGLAFQVKGGADIGFALSRAADGARIASSNLGTAIFRSSEEAEAASNAAIERVEAAREAFTKPIDPNATIAGQISTQLTDVADELTKQAVSQLGELEKALTDLNNFAVDRGSLAEDPFKRNVVPPTIGPTDVVPDETMNALNGLNALLDETGDTGRQAGTTIGDGFRAGLTEIRETITDVATLAQDALTNAFGGAEDALVKYVRTGKDSFKELANSILDDLARIAIRQLTLAAVSAFVPGGGIAASAAGGIAGARAAGGSVGGGRPYLVGEQGPELFVPSRDGTVIASQKENSSGGSSGGVVIINVIGEDDVASLMSSYAGEQVVLNHVLKNKSKVKNGLGG